MLLNLYNKYAINMYSLFFKRLIDITAAVLVLIFFFTPIYRGLPIIDAESEFGILYTR